GAHGGHGWNDDDFAQIVVAAPSVVTVGGIDAPGWLAGGHAGHNWQYGPVVAGLELDFSVTGIDGTASGTGVDLGGTAVTRTRADDVKYLGSLRTRVGTTAQFLGTGCFAGILLHGTAGLAVERGAQTSTVTTTLGTDILEVQRNAFGWVAGAGAEARISDSNWLVRAEYLHYDFDRTRLEESTIRSVAPFSERVGRQTIDVVRGGLSYKWQYE